MIRKSIVVLIAIFVFAIDLPPTMAQFQSQQIQIGSPIHALDWTDVHDLLAVATEDGTFIYDAELQEVVHLYGHTNAVILDVDWKPDGSQLITVGGSTSYAIVWDYDSELGEFTQNTALETGFVDPEYNEHIKKAEWNGDGTKLALMHILGQDPYNVSSALVEVFETQTWTLERSIKPENSLDGVIYGPTDVLTWHPSENYITFADGAAPGSIPNLYVVDSSSEQELGHDSDSSGFFDAVWSHDGTKLAVSAYKLLTYASLPGTSFTILDNQGVHHPSTIAWSADDQYLISVSYTGIAEIYDITQNTLLSRFEITDEASDYVEALAWNSSANQLFFGTDSGKLSVWGTDFACSLCEITGFGLIDVGMDYEIRPLNDGDIINSSVHYLGTTNVQIQANTTVPVGSVKFSLDTDPVFGTDNQSPYRSANMPLTSGVYTLTAIPYSQIDGLGTAGEPVTISYTVDVFPVAYAGSNRTYIAQNGTNVDVTLDGAVSSDPDGTIVNYSWVENGIEIATGVTPQVNLTVGIHTITLTVTDNLGGTATDEVIITVLAPTAIPPTPVPTTPPPSGVAHCSGATIGLDWIVYTSRVSGGKQKIYAMPPDGSTTVKLTVESGGQDFSYRRPAWSPDKTMISFSSDRGGVDKHNVWIMYLDTCQYKQATNNNLFDGRTTWSRTGDEIAFVRQASGGQYDIWKISVPPRAQAFAVPTQLTTQQGSHPSWSPTTDEILFTSNRLGSSDIWAMNINGGNQRVIYRDDAYTDQDADWSGDGQHMAFTSNRNGNDEIYRMELTRDANGKVDGSTGRVRLTVHSSTDEFVSWSPDTAEILFTSNRTGNDDIFKMPSDSGATTPTNLTSGNTGQDTEPNW